jgi:hydrogenase maturation factor
LTDAQTSGGLLLSVPRRNLDVVMNHLKRHHASCAAVIGQIVPSSKPKIRVMA